MVHQVSLSLDPDHNASKKDVLIMQVQLQLERNQIRTEQTYSELKAYTEPPYNELKDSTEKTHKELKTSIQTTTMS